MKSFKMVEVSQEVVEQTARIVGPHSAAAMALRDADARRARGESVAFYRAGSAFLVGPPPLTPDAAQ